MFEFFNDFLYNKSTFIFTIIFFILVIFMFIWPILDNYDKKTKWITEKKINQ